MVTFVGADYKNTPASLSCPVDIPAVSAGDMVVVGLVQFGASTSLSTPPAGWSVLQMSTERSETTVGGNGRLWVLTKTYDTAQAAHTATFAKTGTTVDWYATSSAWSGVSQIADDALSGASVDYSGTASAPAIASLSGEVTRLAVMGLIPYFKYTDPAPTGWTRRSTGAAYESSVGTFERDTYSGAAQAFNHDGGGYDCAWFGVSIALAGNATPNAPQQVAPADGALLDRTTTQRFDWDFSDDDPGDSQSAYNFRYRETGAATWTETGWVSSTATYHDVPGGTFTDGTGYEWQAATKDAQGAEGPWSASWFFTAAEAPTAPTITEPANGGTFNQSQTVAWSTPDQDAYQLRVLDEADAVVSDTGTVNSAAARSTSVEFPTNGVTRTIQLRVSDGGLWSQWAEVTGTVSWLAPPAPTFTLLEDPAQGRMSVVISNPAPSGEEPATSYNDVLIDDDDGKGFDYRRDSRTLAPNGTYIYHLPRSGVDYSDKVRVVSYAENGVYSTSD